MKEIFLFNLLKKDITTYEKIRKITSGQEDYYLTGCLIDYPDSLKELSVDCDRFK